MPLKGKRAFHQLCSRVSDDFLSRICRALGQHNVRYLLVGEYAVGAHGYPKESWSHHHIQNSVAAVALFYRDGSR
jgi:hypothetical protein